MSKNYEILNSVGRRPTQAMGPKQLPPLDARGGDFRSTPIDAMHIISALRRHWKTGVVFLGVVVAVVAIVTFASSPVYEPSARIAVDPPGTEVFSLQSTSQSSTDILRIIATQSQILNSDELAIKVIRKLRLDARNDLGFSGAGTASPNTGPQLTIAESNALRYFRKHLQATPVKASQSIEIKFASHNAKLSRDVVNTLLSLCLEKNYQSRFDAVTQSSEWLARQLVDIRKKAEDSNRALAQYQKAHNVAEVGTEQSTMALKIGELSRQVTVAGAERIQLESFNRAIERGNGDSLPQLQENPVVQNLATELAKVRSELSQAEVIYGKKHPNVQKLRNSETTLESQLRRERNLILDSIQTSYSAAKAREELMTRQLASATAGVGAMGEYAILKREAQASTDLYNTLYARIKEAGITAASKSSNIRVLEEARLLDRPTRPVPLNNLALAVLFGLVGGVVTIFLRDRFDRSLRAPEELPQLAGLPTTTFLPRFSVRHAPQHRLMAWSNGREHSTVSPFLIDDPGCDASEAIRTLVSSLLNRELAPRVMLVSSAFPREGKTTIAVNLAIALSEVAETCIIDADLRRPAVASAFGISPEPGLGMVLAGHTTVVDEVLTQCPAQSKLQIIPAGHAMMNPGAALMTGSIENLLEQVRSKFRFVIIDSPPLLNYADARILAPLADGVILVGRYGYTERAGIEQAINIVNELSCNFLGFVFNAVDSSTAYGYAYYSYPRTTA